MPHAFLGDDDDDPDPDMGSASKRRRIGKSGKVKKSAVNRFTDKNIRSFMILIAHICPSDIFVF